MSKVTYTDVIKFPRTQRLWKGSDGKYYLADESADESAYYANGYKPRIGKPDETDDGPLSIVLSEPLVARYSDDGMGTDAFAGFSVTVVARDRDNDRVRCTVCIDGALYLAAYLGMALRTKQPTGEYRITPTHLPTK